MTRVSFLLFSCSAELSGMSACGDAGWKSMGARGGRLEITDIITWESATTSASFQCEPALPRPPPSPPAPRHRGHVETQVLAEF